MMNFVSNIMGFYSSKNDEFCLQNDEVCIKNDESCIEKGMFEEDSEPVLQVSRLLTYQTPACSTGLRNNPYCCSEFCIKNDDLCIENDELLFFRLTSLSVASRHPADLAR